MFTQTPYENEKRWKVRQHTWVGYFYHGLTNKIQCGFLPIS